MSGWLFTQKERAAMRSAAYRYSKAANGERSRLFGFLRRVTPGTSYDEEGGRNHLRRHAAQLRQAAKTRV